MRQMFIYIRQFWIGAPRRRLLTVALTLLVGFLAHTSHAAQIIPTLVIEFPAQSEVGHPMSITLTAQAVEDIGGYEMTLLYDTTVVELNGLRLRNSEIRTPGRGVEPLIAERPDGLSIGVYSCPFAECVRPAPGSPRQPRGATGAVRLGEVRLIANAPGVIEVRLSEAKFVTADGTVINVILPVQPLLIEVGAPLDRRYPAPTLPLQPEPQLPTTPPGPFDLTGDGLVNYADSVTVAVDWTVLRSRGVVCETSAQRVSDVNHDGCLDIVDLQQLTHHFTDPPDPPLLSHTVYLPHMVGPGVATPIPTQTPTATN